MKVSIEKEKAVRVVSHFSDFEPPNRNADKSEAWKIAFYELWRLQMTWGYAYEIEARENRQNGVYVDVLTKETYVGSLIGTMEELGFGNITKNEELVGLVAGYELDDKTYSVFVDW